MAGAEETRAQGEALAAEHVRLGGGQSYVVCAFYTPNYLPQVLSLKASLEALGIDHYLKRYEPRESWEAATRLKPVFVDHCLARFPDRNVVYLDADAVVRQPLAFFDDLKADVSMLFDTVVANGRQHLRIAAGTLFVANSAGGRRFATLWKAQEERCHRLALDEDMIYMAFRELAGVSIAVLPPAYSKIFDKPGVAPVVEHFQASRGQYKEARAGRRRRRRIRRAAIAAGAVALALAAWWLSRHLVIGWR